MLLKEKFVQAVDAGKLWPTILVMSFIFLVALGIVTACTVGFLIYRHVIVSPYEADIEYGSFFGTKHYFELLNRFHKTGAISDEQYKQWTDDFTPDMARHFAHGMSFEAFWEVKYGDRLDDPVARDELLETFQQFRNKFIN